MGRIAWVNDSSTARAYYPVVNCLLEAYDLNNRRAGFQVGLLLILVATFIVDTAYGAQKYGQERLRETLGHLFVPSLGWILLVSVMIAANAWAAFVATDPKIRGQMVCGLTSGLLVGVGAWFFLDFFILFSARPSIIGSPLVHACADLAKSPVSNVGGYSSTLD